MPVAPRVRRMNGLASSLGPVDWTALAAWLLLGSFLAWTAHRRAGTARDFFLAGRSLPWPLVAASSIATETGVVAFLLLPGTMAALEGNLTPLCWAIGSLAARAVIGCCFVRTFYDGEVQSPYDVMGKRLGPATKALGSALFLIGAVFGHGARVLVAVLPLALVSGLSFPTCFAVVALCAVLWTCLGGIRAVVWTDLLQLALLLGGCASALLWTVGTFDDGWTTLRETLASAERFDGTPVEKSQLLDFGFWTDGNTNFWISVFAVPFIHLHALGVDQVHAQRLFCCRGPSEARRAVLWSFLGQSVNALLLLLGAAIFVFLHLAPPTDPAILSAMEWSGGGPGEPYAVLPLWVATELPPLPRCLLIAGFFAAAVSALDSLLLALSQTSASLLRRNRGEPAEARRLVRHARALVVAWGAIVATFAFLMLTRGEPGGNETLSLAGHLLPCVAGPLLGIFLVALRGRGNPLGLVFGTMLSLLLLSPWVLAPSLPAESPLGHVLAQLPLFERIDGSSPSLRPRLALEWGTPLSALLTMLCGWSFSRRNG